MLHFLASIGRTVIRYTDDGFDLVDFSSCVTAPACRLAGVLNKAMVAFIAVLDGYTLGSGPIDLRRAI